MISKVLHEYCYSVPTQVFTKILARRSRHIALLFTCKVSADVCSGKDLKSKGQKG
ncbi:MAG: hypothetical protein ACHBN1_23875 [Heteroscytonema crispum UTEX LB 1556]